MGRQFTSVLLSTQTASGCNETSENLVTIILMIINHRKAHAFCWNMSGTQVGQENRKFSFREGVLFFLSTDFILTLM